MKYFRVPADKDKRLNMSRQPDPQQAAVKILHLEDSHLDAEIVGYYLNNGGLSCKITVVGDMLAFQKALTDEMFDLILCDQNVPGWPGASPAQIARTLQPAIPLIVLSGNLDNFENSSAKPDDLPTRVLKSELASLVPAVRQTLETARAAKNQAAA